MERRKVIEIWEEMKEREEDYIKQFMEKRRKTKRKFKDLHKVVDKIAAGGIVVETWRTRRKRKRREEQKEKQTEKVAPEVLKELAESLDETKKTNPEMTTVKYAGQEIQIAQAKNEHVEKDNPQASKVDSVLSQLKGVESISTVTKSKNDWETFKEDKGLSDELQQVTKDGYLTKQEFLQRCDYRQFEQERDARQKRRK